MLSGRRKLLLADDSPTIQKVITLTFEDMEVVAVSDGEQAARALDEGEPPDILLADVWMPGPDGYELCERVKRDERLRHVPVVLLVGTFEPFNEAEARRVGADTVLTKPFQSIRDLVSKVGSLLGGEQKHERHDDDEASQARDSRDEAPAASLEAEATTRPRDDAALDPSDAHAAARDEGASAAAPELADLGADDELIEAKPADSFGGAFARTGDAARESSADAQPSGFNEQPFAPAEARAEENRDEQRDEYRMQDFQHEPSFAASHAEPSHEPAAQPSFAARAARAAAADDALLDLGQLDEPAPAVSEADDFILDLDEDLPPAHASSDTPSAFASDAPSAFAEAAHGEPSASMEQSARAAGQPAHASDPFDFSAPAQDAPVPAEFVMQDEPQGASSWQESGSAPRGFVEPSVVPASGPVPATVEGSLTDGSVEGDVAKPPASGYHTQPVEESAPPAPFVPPHEEPSAAGFAVGEARAGVEEHAGHLSQEDVDRIARRVVELMSEKVVREIAWEVVPELAELVIRQRLDEERQK